MGRPTKHVYYSLTKKNPYLPPEYYESLLDDLDELMVQRMLKGKWLSIGTECVYYTYDENVNFLKNKTYEVNTTIPIRICFDFNIGEGKPLSVALIQYDEAKEKFHAYEEVIIQGIRTEAACEEMLSRGLLDHHCKYIIHGDATGRSRSTNSMHTNYEIIENFFANVKRNDGTSIDFEIQVPLSNPPIRKRHMKVRAFCKNAKGKIRLFVYGNCKTLNRGLKLTKLKKGGQFIEDDTKEYQHVTTALGYGVVETIRQIEIGETTTTQL